MSRHALRPARAGLVLLVGLAAAIGIATPAAAHSAIIDSSPPAGAELDRAPEVFSVTANEDLADLTGTGDGFALQVVEVGSGDVVPTGTLTIDGPTLSTPGVPLEPGAYLLRYQVVSADGHPISGEVAFTILGEDEPVAEPENETDAPGAPGPDPQVMALGGDPAMPFWIGGAIALVLVLAGGLAAALIRRRR